MDISNGDWKLFREKLPIWQERHMERLNLEYIRILNGSGNSSEKFWTLDKRIQQDKRHPGVCTELTRKNMIPTIVRLLRDNVIEEADVTVFSDAIREEVAISL